MRALMLVAIVAGAGAACAGLLGIESVDYPESRDAGDAAPDGVRSDGAPSDAGDDGCFGAPSDPRVYVVGGGRRADGTSGNVQWTSTRNVYSASISDAGLGCWRAEAPLPRARNALAVTDTPAGIVAAGGRFDDGTITDEVLYLPLEAGTGQWLPQPGLGSPRHFHATVRLGMGMSVFEIAGYTVGPTLVGDTQRGVFGPTGGIATWAPSEQPLRPRGAHAAVGAFNALFVAGGLVLHDGGVETASQSVEYAPVQGGDLPDAGFASAASLQIGRYGLTMVAHLGHLYVLGGFDASGNASPAVEVAAAADAAPSTWNTTQDMKTARAFHCAAAHEDYVVVAGGFGGKDTDGSPALTSVEVGHLAGPGIDGWAKGPDLPEPLAWLACAVFPR